VSNLLKVKVPQMGWNQIYNLKSDSFKGISEKEYLVHSFMQIAPKPLLPQIMK
jgi:imidazoleglycerol phosphate synthase glutamine amidotransferase subunit HisH